MNILENQYRDWLVNKVNIVEDRDYGPLLRELFRIEFYWTVPNDEDRAMDGVELRDHFLYEMGINEEVNFGPARVLEVLIGIAKRVEFQLFGSRYMDECTYEKVFWDLIWNLGLEDMDGTLLGSESDKIRHSVTFFMDRKYKRHKKGNIFDIENSDRNPAKMSIWAQMMVYTRQKWPI